MSYNSIEPTVIDEELLKKAVLENASEVAKKEGVEHHEVLTLRLDYRSIFPTI